MLDQHEQELEQSIASLEALRDVHDSLIGDTVSLESTQPEPDYLQLRKLQELELSVGMEANTIQVVKDVFSAIGRTSLAMGRGFMKFLDNVHRLVDSTHLVRLRQTREKLKAIPASEAGIVKGRMERAKLAAALAIDGDIPSNFRSYADGMADFSRRTTNAMGDMASMSRQIGARLEAKRWMGNSAFNDEVVEITKIIGQYKLPMQRYPDTDYRRLFPGNRSIFSNIKPKRPRREPVEQTAAAKKVIDGVSNTIIGIAARPDYVKGKADTILPILTVEQGQAMLDSAEILLKEALRVAQVAKAYSKDKVPSTFSMMISGFFHGVKRQFDDVWTAQDDGYDVVEVKGGVHHRHKPGVRNPLGGAASRLAQQAGMGMESLTEDEQRAQLAVWVSRYLKLSLIDHQRTAQSLILLLVAVAKSYMDYVDESLEYYS